MRLDYLVAHILIDGDVPDIHNHTDRPQRERILPGFARPCSRGFQFSDDGIHLRTAGAYAAGDYISRMMAFLDAQPCPQPAYAGVEPMSPCPNPDVHGPVIDLESLYPLGERGPDAGFQLSWEGSGSWPAPPWWER